MRCIPASRADMANENVTSKDQVALHVLGTHILDQIGQCPR